MCVSPVVATCVLSHLDQSLLATLPQHTAVLLQGLDVLPFMSPGAAADQHLASGQPMRLRLTGHTKLNGTLSRPDSDAQPAGPQPLAGSMFSGEHWPAGPHSCAFLADLQTKQLESPHHTGIVLQAISL